MITQPQLTNAIEQLDREYGRGYAKEHPELVGQYLVAHAIREIDETLSTSAQAILDFVEKCASTTNIMKMAPGLFKSIFSG
jgi:hypothetical protein